VGAKAASLDYARAIIWAIFRTVRAGLPTPRKLANYFKKRPTAAARRQSLAVDALNGLKVKEGRARPAFAARRAEQDGTSRGLLLKQFSVDSSHFFHGWARVPAINVGLDRGYGVDEPKACHPGQRGSPEYVGGRELLAE
jgi:hypothetical protein